MNPIVQNHHDIPPAIQRGGWAWIDRTESRSGLQWRFRESTDRIDVYIPGTDHADDWRHHAKIRLVEAANGLLVTRADLYLARDIVRMIGETDKAIRIGGHSWGGAVAALIVWIGIQRGWSINGRLYGPKQVGNQAFIDSVSGYVTAYRHRGDIVPVIIPWLARYQMKKIGRMTWPWVAHGPATYYDQMEADGFRDNL